MLRIDPSTVIVLLGTSSYAAAWALWLLRRQSSCKDGLYPLGLSFATLGTASLFAGVGLFHLLPKIIWANVSLLGGSAGFMTLVIGIRALNHGRIRRYVITAMAILGVLALVSLSTSLWAVDSLRASVYLIFGMCCETIAAWKVARKHRTEPLPSRIPLMICQLLSALTFLGMLIVGTHYGFSRGYLSWGFAIQMQLYFLTTVFIYGLVRDRLEKIQRSASETDVLTKIGNRHWFESSAPYHPACEDALILFDIGYFKAIKYEHGRLAGDGILRTVDAAVTHLHRADDLLARHGGEEFILLLDEVERAELIHVAERLRNGVQNLRIDAGHHSL